jgi:hypothetical protein
MIQDKTWERFMSLPDSASAVAIAGYFERNGLPSRVEAGSPGVDLSPAAHILVQGHLFHRARWLLAQQADMTEAELEFLATGRLGDETPQQ